MPIIIPLDKEIEDRVTQYRDDPEKNFTESEAVYLDAMINNDTWNLNRDDMEALRTMIENLPFSYAGRDALLSKIDDKLAKIPENTNTDEEDYEYNDNENEVPREEYSVPVIEDYEYNMADYDKLPAYELLKEYERLGEKNDADSADRRNKIWDLAHEALDGAKIDSENAPLLDTYYRIMRLDDPNYPVPEEELAAALKQYDQNHGLVDLDLTADEWKQNYEEWRHYLNDDYVSAQLETLSLLSPLKKLDPYLFEECVQTLGDSVATELSTQPFSTDAQTTDLINQKIEAYCQKIDAELADLSKDADHWFVGLSQEEQYRHKQALAESCGVSVEEIENNSNNYAKDFANYLFLQYLTTHPERIHEVHEVVESVNVNYASNSNVLQTRLATRTNAPALMREHTHWYKNLKEKYPKSMEFTKNILLSGVAATIPGGLMALSVYKLGETYSEFKKQYKEKFPDKPAKMKNILAWICRDEEKINKLMTRTLLAGVSVLVGGDLIDAALKPSISVAITTLSGTHTYMNKKIGIDAQKKDLIRLLQQYNPDFDPSAKGKNPDKDKLNTLLKSLDKPSKLSKFFRRKKQRTDFDTALQEITQNADISPKDRERIEKLVKDIKAKKSQRKAAVLGIAAGAFSVLGFKFAKDWFNTDHTDAAAHETSADENRMTETNQTSETAQETQTTEAPEQQTPPTALFDGRENNPNLDFAVNATPTPTYHKLIELGVLSEERAQELMGGRSYIPSRILNDYLQNEAQFTPEQQEEFNNFINDRDARMAEFEADKAAHSVARHASHSSGNTHSSVSNSGASTNTPASNSGENTSIPDSDATNGADNEAPAEAPLSQQNSDDIKQRVKEAKYRLTLKNGEQADVSGEKAIDAYSQYAKENNLDPSQGKIQATLVNNEDHSVTKITAKGNKTTIVTYGDENQDGIGQRSERLHTTKIKQDDGVTTAKTRGDLDGDGRRGDNTRVATNGQMTSQYTYIKGGGRTLDLTDSQGKHIRYERVDGQTVMHTLDEKGKVSSTEAVQGNPGIKTLRRFWEKQIKSR
ncbi:MAG: hypothetical protein IJ852_01380 [Alphaproteobacteria bacterium]|nr:hypothetical protein [Alphaproteobacteria bacterium]